MTDSPLRIKLAKRLKAARLHRLERPCDVVRRTKIRMTSLGHYESGRRTPTLERLVILAKSLRVSTDFLLGMTDDFSASSPTDDIVELFQTLNEDEQELTKKIMRVAVEHIMANREKVKPHSTPK